MGKKPSWSVKEMGIYAGIGGRNLTLKFVAAEVLADSHPLGPESKLVIARGLLSGSAAAISGRLSVGCKSPLTGGIKEANAGGQAAQTIRVKVFADLRYFQEPEIDLMQYNRLPDADWRRDFHNGTNHQCDNRLDYEDRVSNKWLLASIDGTPVWGIKGLEFGAMINVIPFLGVGASWGMVFDNLVDYAESHYLTFGVVGRPRYNMELGIMFGFATGGTIWTDNNNGGEIKGIDPYFSFPGNYQVWFGWRVIDNLMFQAKYVGTSLGNLESQLQPGYQYPSSDYEFLTGRFSIMALYSYAISGNR